MAKLVLPPLDSTLLTLLDYLDFHAKHNADQPYFLFPSSNDLTGPMAALSFGEVARASHRIAHILRPGREGKDGDVIGLLLHTDTVLYVAVVLGALRAGLVPYTISPRNSAEAVCNMLDATNCTRIVSHDLLAALVAEVRADRDARGKRLHIQDIPDLLTVYPTLGNSHAHTSVEAYPTPQVPVDIDDVCVYLHSSGSTGLPKSIPWTHRYIAKWFRLNLIAGARQRGICFGAMGLPTFHAMGLSQQLFFPLASAHPVVVYAPQHPAPPAVPHPQSIFALARASGCSALSLVPSVVEAWARSDEIVQFLSTLQLVTYGGGPLAQSVGDRLVAAGVRLRSVYGGTEFSGPVKLWPEPLSAAPEPLAPSADWAWLAWTAAATARMVPQGDGTYELVLFDNEEYPLAVYNVHGEKAYATSDLFEPHPTKEGLWKIVGRKDDVIILSNGEKIVPIPQEGHIGTSPLLMGAVMFGRGREQAGLLVEPAEKYAFDPRDEAALIRFRHMLWPVVEEANSTAPAFAKIFKEMIIVTDPAKPLPRAGKGTIQRKAALAAYADEIDKLYETVSESTSIEGIDLPRAWTEDELIPWLSAQATSVNDDHEPTPDKDLFQQGFDSLSATFFRNRIIGALRATREAHLAQVAQNISPNLVFEHLTIRALASFLSRAADPTLSDQPSAPSGIAVADIEALVHKYTGDLPAAKATRPAGKPAPVVLLTGSTGNIGSHILASLLADTRIERVYTLDRPSVRAPLERLKAAFEERALPADMLDDPRLVALAGDVTQERFGLGAAVYDEVLGAATHLIHNAWPVNFNLPLQAYEAQVAGVRRLVDVCAAAPRHVRLLMTSSIGAASLWDARRGAVPEAALPDPAVAASNGYSASKYVVEQILTGAVAKGLGATVVRMGQACGAKATGAWGTTEWMPIMVKSSASLGCLPAMSGPIRNWVPLDAIGEAYVDWVTADGALPAFVNVVHPRPTSWDVVLRGLREELGWLPVVPLDVWVAKLDAMSGVATADDLARVPALKLLALFRRWAAGQEDGAEGVSSLVFASDNLQHSSPTMRELQPLSEEHARMWVRYWRSRHYL
ncbi:acetyl-CoA synthetase-like protein [Phanerochaete sordida]|uniref:Acetyl-CoA synthetase-like protein n=1 Tax=Phanerochaete sordida TaxID=48140 RepID=A0A9P3G6H4_9APHY|nr:acetyl-CoA synthetase-like protein [Phanerochaete sordida]